MHRNAQKGTEMHRNAQKWTEMHRNAQKFTEMHQTVAKVAQYTASVRAKTAGAILYVTNNLQIDVQ